MGESRWRKANDPLYGKVPQNARQRGLVISPPLHISGNELHLVSSSLDEQELRFALLFWDRLAWPTSNMIHIESGPDERFLEHEGLLSRPEFQAFGDMAQGVAAIQFRAFEELDAKAPGSWAMAQGERSFHLIGADRLSEGNGTTVQLHQAIPIPNVDVPLAEILEFKRRRNDELLQLRYHLDFIKDGIANAERSQDALTTSIAAIDQSCSDLLRCGSEWQFPMRLSDLEFSISFNPISAFGNASAGWMLGQQYGLPVAAAAAAAMSLQSCLSINRSFGFRSVRRPKTPFRYAFLAHNELF